MIASNNLKLIFNQDLKTGDEYVYNVHVSLKDMEKKKCVKRNMQRSKAHAEINRIWSSLIEN